MEELDKGTGRWVCPAGLFPRLHLARSSQQELVLGVWRIGDWEKLGDFSPSGLWTAFSSRSCVSSMAPAHAVIPVPTWQTPPRLPAPLPTYSSCTPICSSDFLKASTWSFILNMSSPSLLRSVRFGGAEERRVGGVWNSALF